MKPPSEGFTESEYQEWKKSKPIYAISMDDLLEEYNKYRAPPSGIKSALDDLFEEYNKFMAPPEVMARPEEGI